MEKEESKRKYIVLDIVFYGSSLNYDWGGGTNYQELKKITKWDGRQYVLVSRYALRYSILHWANKMFQGKWKLAGKDVLTGIGENEVVRLKSENEVKKEFNMDYKDFLKDVVFNQYPEFDLFGFMIAEGGGNQSALTRTSPIKISHALSMTPTNIDVHTMANLDMKRRAGGKGSNPVTIEEKTDFYIYNVTIDVDRMGKYLLDEHGEDRIGDITIDSKLAKDRIEQLLETLLHLKRDIKGRREDLSPWLIIVGLYKNGRYETFMDKIRLDRKTHYKVIRKYKKEGDTEIIENEIEEGLMPLFNIGANEIAETPPLYYKEGFCDYEPKDKFEILSSKKAVVERVREFLEK